MMSMQAVLYALAMKVLNEDEMKRIEEMMTMTLLGQMLMEDGMEKGEFKNMLIVNKLMANKPEGDRFCQFPERALIYSFYNISYNALRLFLIIAGQKNGFEVETNILCSRANLKIKA